MPISALKNITLVDPHDLRRNTLVLWLPIVCVVSLLFSLAGPFGTFQEGNFFGRLSYWFVLVSTSVVIALVLKSGAVKFLSHWTAFGRESVIVCAMTLLFTPFLWIWTLLTFPALVIDPPSMLWMGGFVFIICTSISVLAYGVPFVLQDAHPIVPSKEVSARLNSRLPETFDGKIFRLSVDGHMVSVVTDTGVFEVRMRFSDAVNEVSELAGVCTHRSHWVVLDAIASVAAANGRPVLVMTNGDEVPVSRKYQPHLETLGIL